MKKLLWMVALAMCLVAAGCSKDDADEDVRPQSVIIGTWKAYEYRKEHSIEFKSMDVFKWKGMSNELVINRNGTFRCGAYPFQPETTGYYQIDDNKVKFYTDEQMLEPAFKCLFLEIKNDTAWVRFSTMNDKDYFYDVNMVKHR